jgi:Porphobilinogen deaminase, dipyromethane cofactor binding domain
MTPAPQDPRAFQVGTRKSQLALLQTDIVVRALQKAWPEHQFNVCPRDTAAGDLDKVTPFKDMPVKNLWTHDLEQSLLEEKLDLLVHSLKGKPAFSNCGSISLCTKMFPPSCQQTAALGRFWTVKIHETHSCSSQAARSAGLQTYQLVQWWERPRYEERHKSL